jgi:hypothetical protein
MSGRKSWSTTKSKTWRLIDTVALPQGVMESLIDNIPEFMEIEDRYGRAVIPHHRGYLLCGPLGTGKRTYWGRTRVHSTHIPSRLEHLRSRESPTAESRCEAECSERQESWSSKSACSLCRQTSHVGLHSSLFQSLIRSLASITGIFYVQPLPSPADLSWLSRISTALFHPETRTTMTKPKSYFPHNRLRPAYACALAACRQRFWDGSR